MTNYEEGTTGSITSCTLYGKDWNLGQVHGWVPDLMCRIYWVNWSPKTFFTKVDAHFYPFIEVAELRPKFAGVYGNKSF